MLNVKISLRDGRTEEIACDAYKENPDDPANYLRFYRGGRKVAQYGREEVIGYQELPPRSKPPPAKPWMR